MLEAKKIHKIGILGGTFDPVHEGHLAVAQTVLDRFHLDGILFVPAYSPPHKDRSLTPFSHRVAMLEAALEDEERMSISLLEAERSTPSYTVETLSELHRRMESSSFYLIMGADMFIEIELWYRYKEIIDQADIIVAARPGFSQDMVTGQIARLPGSFSFDVPQQVWYRDDGSRILYCADVSESISSSQIRQRIRRGDPVTEYLTPAVWRYIQQHRLYVQTGTDH